MDWTVLLKNQQFDFIQRLKTGHLLQCETPGRHRELTVISGLELEKLQKLCWQMAERGRETSPIAEVFIDYMTRKLGEEVVKACLGDLVTKFESEYFFGREENVDFMLASSPEINIAVKASQGNWDTVTWSINSEKIEKNAVLVCILITDEVREYTAEYSPILAGFLPTNNMGLKNGKASVRIDELLYGGGLPSYLQNLASGEVDGLFIPIPKTPKQDEPTSSRPQDILLDATTRSYGYLSMGIDRYKEGNYHRAIEDFNEAIRLNPQMAAAYNYRGSSRRLVGDYEGAVEDYHYALQLIPKNAAIVYNNLGIADSNVGDKQGAIANYDRALRINPQLLSAYYNRGVARAEVSDREGAIDDYTAALEINPNLASVCYNRAFTRSEIGDKQGAIEDYTEALKINPNLAAAYYNRGLAYGAIADSTAAFVDYQKAADIYQQQGKEAEYQEAIDRIKELHS